MYGPPRNAPQFRHGPPGHQLPGPPPGPPPGMMNMNRPFRPPVMQGRGPPMHPPHFPGGQQQQQQQSGFGLPPNMVSNANHGMPPGPPPAHVLSGIPPGSMPPGPPPITMAPLPYPAPPMPFMAPAPGPLPRGPPLPGGASVLPPIPPPSFTVFPHNTLGGAAPPPPLPPPSPPPLPSSPPPPPPPPPPPSPLYASPEDVLAGVVEEALAEAPEQALAEAPSEWPQVEPHPSKLTSLPPPPLKPSNEEVVCSIETLSKFVVKNGPEFENMARAKEAGNPKFSFLFDGEPGSDAAIGFKYYQWMKMKCYAETKMHKVIDVKQLAGALPLCGPTHEFKRVEITSEEVSNSPIVSDTEMEEVCHKSEFEGPSVEDLSPIQSSPKELRNTSEDPCAEHSIQHQSSPKVLHHISEGPFVGDLTPVRYSLKIKNHQDVCEVPCVQDVSPVHSFSNELQHTSDVLQNLSPVPSSPKEVQHASDGIHIEDLSPVQSSLKELQHGSEGHHVEDPSPVQSSPKEHQLGSEGLHAEDQSPVEALQKDLVYTSERPCADLCPAQSSLKRLQEMYIEDLSPVRYSPNESDSMSDGSCREDMDLVRSSPKELTHTSPGTSAEDASPLESLDEEEQKVPNSNEGGIEKEGHTFDALSEDRAAELKVDPERYSETKETCDLMPIVCESANPSSTVPAGEFGEMGSDNNMVLDMVDKKMETLTPVPDNNTLTEVNEPLKHLAQSIFQANNSAEVEMVESNVEKPIEQERKMLNVDEFGRLIREGASDSESDGVLYTRKVVKTSRSRSRSRSPVTRSRRRSPSPRRRRARRSRSRSWSPRGKRSRSRTPPAEFRRGDEPWDGRKRRGNVPECIYFKRDGRCNRGASCRFIHQQAPTDDIRKWSFGGSTRGHTETVQDIQSSHIATESSAIEISAIVEEGKVKSVTPDILSNHEGALISDEEPSEKEKQLNEAQYSEKGLEAWHENENLQLTALNMNSDSHVTLENANPDLQLHPTPLENEVGQPVHEKGGDTQSDLLRQEDLQTQPLEIPPSNMEEVPPHPFPVEGFSAMSLPIKDLRMPVDNSSLPLEDFRSPVQDFISQPLHHEDSRSQHVPLEQFRPQALSQPLAHEGFQSQPLAHEGFQSQPIAHEGFQSQPLAHEGFQSQPLAHEGYQSQPLAHEGFQSQPLHHEDSRSPHVPLEQFRSQALPQEGFQFQSLHYEDTRSQHVPPEQFRPQALLQPLAQESFQSQSLPRPPLTEDVRAMQSSNAVPLGDFRPRPLPVSDFHSHPPPGEGFPPRLLAGEPRPLSMEDFRSRPLTDEDIRSRPLQLEEFRPRPLPGDDFRSRPLPGDDFRSRPLPGDDFRSRPLPGEDFRSRPLPVGDFRSRALQGEDFRSRPHSLEGFSSRPLPMEGLSARPLSMEGLQPRPMSTGSLLSQPLFREDAHRENFQSHLLPRQDFRSPPLFREDLHQRTTLQEGLRTEPILRRDLHGQPLFRNDSHAPSLLREELHLPHLLREDSRTHALPGHSQVQLNGFPSNTLHKDGLQFQHLPREDLRVRGDDLQSRDNFLSKPYSRDELRFPHLPRDLPNLQQHDLTRQQLPSSHSIMSGSSSLVQRNTLQGNSPLLSHFNLTSNIDHQRPGYFGGYTSSSNHGSFTAGTTGFTPHAPFRSENIAEPFDLHHLSGSRQGSNIPRPDTVPLLSAPNIIRPGLEPLPRSLGSNLSVMGGEWQSHPFSLLGGSSGAVSAIFHQPGRDFSAPGDQYDPLHDSIEPASHGANGSLKELFESDTDKVNDAKAVHQSTMVSHFLDVEENNKRKDCATSALKELDVDNVAETAMDAEVGVVENGSPVLDEEVKNWSPGQPLEIAIGGAGEIEIDRAQATTKSKKSKDNRSIKLFRLALAEFVKDVLKPSWREGNMSKEAFKTIVKKAVDKVAGAMQSHQIPKTRAKIDQYVASSERKLTKLVQGYMNKYVRA